MEVKTIVFKRVKNLGNYESEHLEIVGDLEPGDDVNKEVDKLREIVETKLFLKKTQNNDLQAIEDVYDGF